MSEASNQHSDPRCGNTIHSNYVTDWRCQRERGHLGDCWFGSGFVEQYGTARDLVSAFVREAENAGWFEDMDEWGREDWGLINVKGGTMLDAKAFLDGASNPAKSSKEE